MRSVVAAVAITACVTVPFLVSGRPADSATSACVAPTKLGLHRAVGSARATLRWKAPRGGIAYRVYRGTAVVGQTRARSISVRVSPGRRVQLVVRAVLEDGSLAPCAARLSLLVRWMPPSRPLQLSAAAIADGARLSWQRARRGDGRLVGYRVFRNGVPVGQTRGVNYQVAVPPLKRFAFTVAAVDQRGKLSRRSKAVSVLRDHSGPSAPVGLFAEPESDTAITLRWEPVTAARGVKIAYRITRDGVTVAQTQSAPFTLTRLAAATRYSISIVAVDSLGYVSPPSATIEASTKEPEKTTGGVHAYLLASTGASFTGLQARYRQIGTLYPTYFDCRADGSLEGRDDPLVTRWAHMRGIRVMPRVNCQRPATLTAILRDPAVRSAAIDWMAGMVSTHGYEGINLDFELGVPADRDAYTSFVRDLTSRLHGDGKQLSVAVSPKFKDVPNHPRSTFFDYDGLAASADTIFVMAWGIHWSTSAPGAIDDLPWIVKVADYVAARPNKGQYVIGLGLYGMDWPAGGGTAHPATPLEHADVMALASRVGATPAFDDAAGATHFEYTDAGGVPHAVWYTDARSVSLRADIFRDRGIGIGFWRLGREDASIWKLPQLQPSPA